MTSKSALLRAIVTGDFKQAVWQIDAGVPVDTATDAGETALLQACGSGETQVVRILLQHGADINWKGPRGFTPLMKASAAGHTEIVQILISSGACIDARDEQGRTALEWSQRSHEHKGAADAIIYEIETRSRAVKERERQEALDRDARQVIATNAELGLLVKNAVAKRQLDVLRRLLRGNLKRIDGSDISTITLQQCKSAMARIRSRFPREETPGIDARFFLNAEALGWTPLTIAAANGEEALIKGLVHAGADVQLETRLGHTALTWACHVGHVDIVRYLLLLAHADVEYISAKESKTAVMVACASRRSKVVECLFGVLWTNTRLKANRIPKKTRAVAGASQGESTPFLTELRALERFLMLPDVTNKTALGYAKISGDPATIEALNSALAKVRKEIRDCTDDLRRKKLFKCPLQCGEEVSQRDLERHVGWICVRRLLYCPLGCLSRIEAQEVQEHTEKFCSGRLVRCPNVYAGCMSQVPASEIDFHLSKACQKRIVECRLNCGTRLPYESILHHETELCAKRVVTCPLKCDAESMQASSLNAHVKYACKNRPVQCQFNCGNMLLKAYELEEHEAICPRPCKWGCGTANRLTPDKLELHEMFLCTYRLVDCPNACQVGNMKKSEVSSHLEHECKYRIVPCPLGCGISMAEHKVNEHVAGETAACPLRLLPCRFDYVGRAVWVVRKGPTAEDHARANDTSLSVPNSNLEPVENKTSGESCDENSAKLVSKFYSPLAEARQPEVGMVISFDESTEQFTIRFGRELETCAFNAFQTVKVEPGAALVCKQFAAQDRKEHEKVCMVD
jgi:ankyrin repeat protein